MVTHTPGPWISVFGEMNGYDCMTGAFLVRDRARLKTLAAVDLGSYGQTRGEYEYRSAEAEANANLIAAAPDLLAACRRVVEHFGDPAQGALFGLRAAIAKAEGKPAPATEGAPFA